MQRLSEGREKLFWGILKQICENSRFEESKVFFQHGSTSIYQHSLRVAYVSCLIAEKYHISVDDSALVRGALLHDYFLYDWHDRVHCHKRPHGFFHPMAAYRNAAQDFELGKREKNIILRHMFPLTIIPPACKEAWIVCVADKICSTTETLQGRKKGKMPIAKITGEV